MVSEQDIMNSYQNVESGIIIKIYNDLVIINLKQTLNLPFAMTSNCWMWVNVQNQLTGGSCQQSFGIFGLV